MNYRAQKGFSLIMVLIILSMMTASLLTMITILVSQTKGIVYLSDSVVAFYAADTGIERALYHIYQDGWQPVWFSECPYSWQNFSVAVTSTSYEVCVSESSTSTIQSAGRYNPTKTERKIEINLK